MPNKVNAATYSKHANQSSLPVEIVSLPLEDGACMP